MRLFPTLQAIAYVGRTECVHYANTSEEISRVIENCDLTRKYFSLNNVLEVVSEAKIDFWFPCVHSWVDSSVAHHPEHIRQGNRAFSVSGII